MTTIIGIKAFDPETNEYYSLLGSDNRDTNFYGKPSPDPAQKIFSPENSNYAFASTGKNLLDYFGGTDEKANSLLRKGGKKSKEKLEELLDHVDGTLLEEMGDTNEYILALQEENGIALYSYQGKGLEEEKTNVVKGSGKYHIQMNKELQKYTTENGDIVISPTKLQELVFEALKDVSTKDKYTGGQAQFAIVKSHESISMIKDYAPLQKISKALNEYDIPGQQHPWLRMDMN